MKKTSFEPELLISRWLRYGVMISAATLALGFILMIFNFHAPAEREIFTSVSAVLHGVIRFDPAAIMSLGLLFLILTPILRVAMSVLIFLWEKDYLYVFITFLVLFILVCSLMLGKAL